jgi:hypothetical protein
MFILIRPQIITKNPILAQVIYRMEAIGNDNDDSLEGRGYDRILKYPYYLIWGAGEGLNYRFESNKELHSTLGNILFSYGIIGFGLFLLIFRQAIAKQGLASVFPLYAVLLFGFTHNGIRHTYLWLLLALLYLGKSKVEDG